MIDIEINIIKNHAKKSGVELIIKTNGMCAYNTCSTSIEINTCMLAGVLTIYAGGYNIQCLHYRVLVKPVKS